MTHSPQGAADTSRIAPPQPQLAPLPTRRRLPGWRLWLPLLIQAGLIAFVPAHDAYTYATGRLVTLQTMPVDPYDLLRGYSQTLGYEVGNLDRLRKLPGGDWLDRNNRGMVYIVLQAPAETNATPPKPWQPVRLSADRPTDLAANQVALRGQYNQGWLRFGLEQFYMPEDQRDQINTDIVGAREQTFVEAKVDAQGNAVLVSLWVRDHNLRF